MSGSSVARSYFVAASMGTVEALKDLGFARWNHTIRSLNQQIKSNLRRQSQGGASKAAASSSSSSSMRDQVGRISRSKEEKVRRVMEIDCWGPSTLRF